MRVIEAEVEELKEEVEVKDVVVVLVRVSIATNSDIWQGPAQPTHDLPLEI